MPGVEAEHGGRRTRELRASFPPSHFVAFHPSHARENTPHRPHVSRAGPPLQLTTPPPLRHPIIRRQRVDRHRIPRTLRHIVAHRDPRVLPFGRLRAGMYLRHSSRLCTTATTRIVRAHRGQRSASISNPRRNSSAQGMRVPPSSGAAASRSDGRSTVVVCTSGAFTLAAFSCSAQHRVRFATRPGTTRLRSLHPGANAPK